MSEGKNRPRSAVSVTKYNGKPRINGKAKTGSVKSATKATEVKLSRNASTKANGIKKTIIYAGDDAGQRTMPGLGELKIAMKGIADQPSSKAGSQLRLKKSTISKSSVFEMNELVANYSRKISIATFESTTFKRASYPNLIKERAGTMSTNLKRRDETQSKLVLHSERKTKSSFCISQISDINSKSSPTPRIVDLNKIPMSPESMLTAKVSLF